MFCRDKKFWDFTVVNWRCSKLLLFATEAVRGTFIEGRDWRWRGNSGSVIKGQLLWKDSPLYIPKSTRNEKQPWTEVGSQWTWRKPGLGAVFNAFFILIVFHFPSEVGEVAASCSPLAPGAGRCRRHQELLQGQSRLGVWQGGTAVTAWRGCPEGAQWGQKPSMESKGRSSFHVHFQYKYSPWKPGLVILLPFGALSNVFIATVLFEPFILALPTIGKQNSSIGLLTVIGDVSWD